MGGRVRVLYQVIFSFSLRKILPFVLFSVKRIFRSKTIADVYYIDYIYCFNFFRT